MGIEAWSILPTPLAILDVETTGTNPGLDRVVEVSVIRQNPQVGVPEVAFDSLINPKRPVALTHIHGIEDADVSDAPTFAEVAAMVVEALAGAVVVAHNAYFDMRFIEAEFNRLGITFDVPYLCTQQLRPLLGLGPQISLEQMCREYGVDLKNETHVAYADAKAVGVLILKYKQFMAQNGIGTFAQLAARNAQNARDARFVGSFGHLPLAAALAARCPTPGLTKTRNPVEINFHGTGSHMTVRRENYAVALLHAVSDYILTPEEVAYLMRIREQCELTEPQIRAAHVKAYDWVLQMFSQDAVIDDTEREQLRWLHACLRQLGWAPGD